MAKNYDIIIIGAGPAGSNLARLIDGGRYKTLLVDGSRGREKVCGGLISPDAQGLLAKYDIRKGTSERLTYGHHSTRLHDISKAGQKILFCPHHRPI